MGLSKYQAINGRGPGSITLLAIGVVGGAVLLTVSLLFTTFVKGGFKPEFTVNIQAEQVGEGVFEGADVKMDGLRIGQVTKVETQGVDRQFMRITVDPKDAKFLADNVHARFVSSNTLGMTALELFYVGARGRALSEGATVTIPKDSQTVTVTSVMRMVGRQLAKIDTGPVGRIGSVLSFEGSSEGIGRMIATAIEIGRMKVGDDILVAVDPRPALDAAAGGTADLTRAARGVLDGFRANASRIAFLTDRHEDLQAIITFVGKVIGDLINIFPQPEFNSVVDALLSLAQPISRTAGGITSFYDRLPMLIDQIDKAFTPNPDGTVSLQVQLLLAHMPYLAGDPKVVAAGPQSGPAIPGLPSIPGLAIPPGLFGSTPAAPSGGER